MALSMRTMPIEITTVGFITAVYGGAAITGAPIGIAIT
jgi:hypothetical protein